MPRKAAVTSLAGAEDTAPRRSTRIASQPQTEVKSTRKSRTTKKRTADDAIEEGAGEGESEVGKGKTKKVKADDTAEDDAEGDGDDDTTTTIEAFAPIDIGDTLPSLVLKNEKEEDVQIADIAREQGAVVFLVPKADTPGCTNQACGFRDIFSGFGEVGYTVYCLSADSPNAQSKWQTKKELPYSLISDPKRILISALGAGEGGKTKRSHFIFEKGGKLIHKKIPVKATDSPQLALNFIKDPGASS